MKFTKTTALRLMALSGLLPLLYIISCITTQGYPQVEPTFPQLIISGIIVLLTAVILVCGVIGGFSLIEDGKSFASFLFMIASGFLTFILLMYVLILFSSPNPQSIVFAMGDFSGYGFAFTAIFYTVVLFSHVKKENKKIKPFAAAYGVFGILGLIQVIMMITTGDSMDVANAVYPAYYSLFTIDALAVTCIVPAILGIILLILVWKADLPIAE